MLESPILQKLYEAQMQDLIFMEYFVLGLRWNDLPVASTQDQTVQVPNDSDFLLRRINRSVITGLNAVPGSLLEEPRLLMSLIDAGSGRMFNNQTRVPVACVTGTGQRSYDLPDPRIISGGSAVTVIMENNGIDIGSEIHLALIGAKIFYNPDKRVTLADIIGFHR